MYKGSIIIIIEGIDNFIDFDTQTESKLKFWLPKYFPTRVRLIVTADKNSNSFKYLERLGSTILHMKVSPHLYDSMINSMKLKKFIMEADYVSHFFEVIREYMSEEMMANSLYIHALFSCFCPYETSDMGWNNSDPELLGAIKRAVAAFELRR